MDKTELTVDLDVQVSRGGLEWYSTAFKSDLIPPGLPKSSISVLAAFIWLFHLEEYFGNLLESFFHIILTAVEDGVGRKNHRIIRKLE